MRIVETASEMHEVRAALASPVAMMATLGGMHAGHEALLVRARELGRTLVASLFLNPTQFDDAADLERYPRDPAADLALFERHRVDVVFRPPAEEMYPPGGSTEVDPGPVGSVLEGAHRPGHFRGVATVVTKLLTILRPDVAVWGAKDAQQNVVIRRLTRDLRMDVRHEIVATVRAPDGLALSSRNAYLDADERAAAPVLYAALSEAQDLWRRGTPTAAEIRGRVEEVVGRQPLVGLEYVSVADPETLAERGDALPGSIVSLAARVGRARLIDNVVLDAPLTGRSRRF